jgi:hypothetical protein
MSIGADQWKWDSTFMWSVVHSSIVYLSRNFATTNDSSEIATQGPPIEVLEPRSGSRTQGFLSVIEQQISKSGYFGDRKHAKRARVCAIAILAVAVLYALMLPSGGLASMSYDAFDRLAEAHSILASGNYLYPALYNSPGTSILYAVAASLSGRPPEELVKFVNLPALLLTAGAVWLILEITIERWWIAVIAFASILLNTAILSLQNELWSDPLALAVSSVAIAAGIVACQGGKNWFGWICVASVFLSVSIWMRYAMLSGIPILAAVAFWLSKRSTSHREAVLLPLLLPLVTFISFYFFRSSSTRSPIFSISSDSIVSMVATIRRFDIRTNWPAFVQMTDQVLPVALLATWLSVTVVMVGLIAVPAGVALGAWIPEKRSALLICIGYVFVSCIFLLIVTAASHFPMNLRYLLQIYPFILIAASIAADLLLNRRRADTRILGLIIVGLLSIAAARSTRATAMRLLGHGSQQSASGVLHIARLNDLKRISTMQALSFGVVTRADFGWVESGVLGRFG